MRREDRFRRDDDHLMGTPVLNVASRPVLAGTSALFIIGLLSHCAPRPPVRNDYGIPHCPATAADDLLSADALQCWFAAPHGRWRTLSHESHFAVLVVEVDAEDLRDTDDIARRFVTSGRSAFSEILIYVQREPTTDPRTIRRIRWTPDAGLERLEFAEPAAQPPATSPSPRPSPRLRSL